MVKDTQTIRRQFVDEFFECLWPFCEIGAYRVNKRRSTSGAYSISKLWDAALIDEQQIKAGSAYLILRQIIDINFQNSITNYSHDI